MTPVHEYASARRLRPHPTKDDAVIKTLLLAMLFVAVTGGARADMAETNLLNAARTGDTAAIATLIAAGADIETRDDTGATPLLVATHESQVEAAKLLI